MRGHTVFDIHLASDTMSIALEKKLTQLGFARDGFSGGCEGVIRPNHFSKHPPTRDLFVESWGQVMSILGTAPESEFRGYAEAEVVSPQHTTPIQWRAFDPSIPFPFGRLEQEVCPLGKHKDFDLHVTVDLSTLNPDLKRLLEQDINFYYIDVLKASGKLFRVYTCQTVAVKDAPKLYDLVVSYCGRAGGFQGQIKLEATYAYARFPESSPVPPIISKMPFIMLEKPAIQISRQSEADAALIA
jgi:hypothetical protein